MQDVTVPSQQVADQANKEPSGTMEEREVSEQLQITTFQNIDDFQDRQLEHGLTQSLTESGPTLSLLEVNKQKLGTDVSKRHSYDVLKAFFRVFFKVC